jgi:hypothetical protein
MDYKNRELLKQFALLEGNSAHPVAIKIKQYIEGQNVVVDESLEIASVDRSHHYDRVIDSHPDPYEQKIIPPGKAYGFFEPMRTAAANDRSIVLEPSTAVSFK